MTTKRGKALACELLEGTRIAQRPQRSQPAARLEIDGGWTVGYLWSHRDGSMRLQIPEAALSGSPRSLLKLSRRDGRRRRGNGNRSFLVDEASIGLARAALAAAVEYAAERSEAA